MPARRLATLFGRTQYPEITCRKNRGLGVFKAAICRLREEAV